MPGGSSPPSRQRCLSSFAAQAITAAPAGASLSRAISSRTGTLTGRPKRTRSDCVSAGPASDSTEDRDLRVLLPQSDHPHKRSHLAAEVLEKAAGRLPSKFTEVRLDILGESPRLPLRSSLAECSLSGRADFTGHADRIAMANLHAACDVVSRTSATESFCNPAIEAAGRSLVVPPATGASRDGWSNGANRTVRGAEDLANDRIVAASGSDAESFRERARHHASGLRQHGWRVRSATSSSTLRATRAEPPDLSKCCDRRSSMSLHLARKRLIARDIDSRVSSSFERNESSSAPTSVSGLERSKTHLREFHLRCGYSVIFGLKGTSPSRT
jgi:hypothetical protein